MRANHTRDRSEAGRKAYATRMENLGAPPLTPEQQREKWAEEKRRWRLAHLQEIREANATRLQLLAVERIYHGKKTEWTTDELGNRWRQVGDVECG